MSDTRDWNSYTDSTGDKIGWLSGDDSKADAVTIQAAKELGISPYDPLLKQSADGIAIKNKVRGGGASPDRIVALLKTRYGTAKSNTQPPAHPADKSTEAIKPANEALTKAQGRIDDLYRAASDHNSPLFKSLSAQNPYNPDSDENKRIVGLEQLSVANNFGQRGHELLGNLFGGGGTSGEIAAHKAALGGQAAGALNAIDLVNLQMNQRMSPIWQHDKLAELAGLAGSGANIAQGQGALGLAASGQAMADDHFNRGLAQSADQFNRSLAFNEAHTALPVPLYMQPVNAFSSGLGSSIGARIGGGR